MRMDRCEARSDLLSSHLSQMFRDNGEEDLTAWLSIRRKGSLLATDFCVEHAG